MRRLLLLACAIAAAAAAPAEGAVRSEVESPKVGVQDQVIWTVTVEGTSLPDRIPLPPMTNLRLVGGPSISTQMSYVNGQSSQLRSFTYALQPKAVGRAEIGVLRLILPTGEEIAPAVPIDVVPGSVASAAPPRRSRDPFGGDPFGDFFGRGRQRREAKLFVEAKASRTSLFVGEPLLLTYYLYTQASISDLQFADAPQFSGFWAEDVTQARPSGGEPTTVEGVPYRRFPVFSKLLFPTKAGRLTIPASSFRIGVAAQSFFDSGGVVMRATEPVTVEVKPIPEEPGFSGAVGRFKTRASLDRTDLAFGDAATLRFRVEGSGNLKWVDRPPELLVGGAKVYPPQVKSDLKTATTGISGSRTWEFVVVPETAGNLEIPALSFAYFDPAAGQVVRTTTDPIPACPHTRAISAAVRVLPVPGGPTITSARRAEVSTKNAAAA